MHKQDVKQNLQNNYDLKLNSMKYEICIAQMEMNLNSNFRIQRTIRFELDEDKEMRFVTDTLNYLKAYVHSKER